jgi:CBS domain-containing protein
LSLLLKRPVVDAHDRAVGTLEDVVVELRDDDYPIVTGFLIGLRVGQVFVKADDAVIGDASIRLKTESCPSPANRRGDEVLLRADVLRRRLIDIPRGRLVKTYDIRLTRTETGWAATALDVHRHGWLHFGAHAHHPARDWRDFVVLIGAAGRLRAGPRPKWVWRLKPAQIADIIETASPQEQGLLLAEVHEDPALEASVFEELDDDKQAKLLKSRDDKGVAEVLSRMRADDAADAIMELPQVRRQKVLEQLPEPQNRKVLALLGYHPATAGGLMGIDFLALPEERSIADALEKVRTAHTQQPEALTTIYSLGPDGALTGALGLVRALQLDPTMRLRDAAEPGPIFASPDDDIVAITTRMADFNLLSLPVLDGARRMLGIITVDDALEAAIPRDWSRRETGQAAPHLDAPRRRRAP